jgi:hypothetical protein
MGFATLYPSYAVSHVVAVVALGWVERSETHRLYGPIMAG